jgi:hypothetical protein
MYKKVIFILASLLLIFCASAYIWQTYSNTIAQQKASTPNQHSIGLTVSKVDLSWQQGSKAVDLDSYIANNQVSQNIKDKKQRVMLEPELIRFHGILQTAVNSTKADLVTDSLAVWGISPLPEVAFSTYIRSPQGQVIAVYVENTVASHISSYYQPETVLELQAYRLYNYAKGPRLLLVGVKPVEQELALAIKTGIASNTDADINGTDTKDGESTQRSAKASQVVEQETTSL